MRHEEITRLPQLRCEGCGRTFIPRVTALRGCPTCEGQRLVVEALVPVKLWPRWTRDRARP